ncbi:hypothetical protein [Sphingomonas montana]|uniref:hypothetical protein n=1 Tax=Sphingomonas montana TaxID=1843236 RepID=UPI00101AE268|nr:hypothetical protein [Sphingomonas montana]
MRRGRRFAVLLAVPLIAACTAGIPGRSAAPPPVPVLLIPPPAATPATQRRPADATVARCPSAADIRRLRAARPRPLRLQTMPASPAERVARTAAQLGQYEARNAWADQVEDAFARCDRD